jgi:hypothetical protein
MCVARFLKHPGHRQTKYAVRSTAGARTDCAPVGDGVLEAGQRRPSVAFRLPPLLGDAFGRPADCRAAPGYFAPTNVKKTG